MQKHIKHAGEKGFTLIELLIVIAIIGFLAAAVLVAVDPVKRIQDSRDARRFSEANAILNAILTKQVDDRKIFNGLATAPIITHATNSQVIVIDDTGIVCDTDLAENYPGCSQTIDVGATPAGPKSCVANLGGRLAGTVAIDDTNDELDGTSTTFLSQVTVGDELLLSSGETCTATSEVTMTNLLVSCAEDLTGTGSGLTVTNVTRSILPNYIATMPLDPRGAGEQMCDGANVDCTNDGVDPTPIDTTILGNTNTGYYIHRTPGNRIEIGSCLGEQLVSPGAISVKR